MQDEEILSKLSNRHRAFFARAGYTTVLEILASPPSALSQRTKLSSQEIDRCLQTLAEGCLPASFTVSQLLSKQDSFFHLLTLGDPILDAVLEGGLRAGTISELVGEAYALHLTIC